jgi:hypothetical protein
MAESKTTVEFIEPKKEKKEQKKATQANLRDFLDGSFMTREIVMKNFRYLILVTFLGLILIANRYHAEKIVRETNKVQHTIKELKAESVTVSSRLIGISRQSSVAKLVENNGLELKELKKPAKKIVID